MSKKTVFIVMDGAGDEPISQWEGRTPLEEARTPNLDILAQDGKCGVMEPHFSGVLPTSEEGHYSLFGYDPQKHGLRRGIVTAFGVNMPLQKGDVAFRGNFAFVKNGEVVDRRAGRIKTPDELISALRKIKVGGVEVIIESGGEHRLAVVFRGNGLSDAVTDGDPHYKDLGKIAPIILPLDDRDESLFMADAANDFSQQAYMTLRKHPLNKEREKEGLPLANYVLLRGASMHKKIPSFEEVYGKKACCIAGKDLYKGVARSLGMGIIEVKGADGSDSTNLKGKFEAAVNASCDFVFVHIKATDTLAEDGDFEKKKDFIEKIDKHLGIFLKGDDRVVVTSDHSTCSLQKSHCPLDIPFLVWSRAEEGKDETKYFTEKECLNGSFGRIKQVELIERTGILKNKQN